MFCIYLKESNLLLNLFVTFFFLLTLFPIWLGNWGLDTISFHVEGDDAGSNKEVEDVLISSVILEDEETNLNDYDNWWFDFASTI